MSDFFLRLHERDGDALELQVWVAGSGEVLAEVRGEALGAFGEHAVGERLGVLREELAAGDSGRRSRGDCAVLARLPSLPVASKCPSEDAAATSALVSPPTCSDCVVGRASAGTALRTGEGEGLGGRRRERERKVPLSNVVAGFSSFATTGACVDRLSTVGGLLGAEAGAAGGTPLNTSPYPSKVDDDGNALSSSSSSSSSS